MKTAIKSINLSILILILVIGLIYNGCIINTETIDNAGNNQYAAKEDFFVQLSTYSFDKFSLDAINGTVEISTGTNLDSITIQGERIVESESIADAEEHLQYLNVDISQTSNIILVKTIQPSQSNGRNYIVNYRIEIPNDWEVDVEQINGNVDLSGIRGNIRTVVTNGNISVSSCEGNIHTTITNGNSSFSDITGCIWSSIVNGNSTGHITLADSGTCQQSVVNGNLILAIPRFTSAQFSAKTSSGLVNVNNLPLNNAQITTKSVTGTLGTGDGIVNIEAVNGSITVNGF
jgi:hypothetical protein